MTTNPTLTSREAEIDEAMPRAAFRGPPASDECEVQFSFGPGRVVLTWQTGGRAVIADRDALRRLARGFAHSATTYGDRK